VVVTAPPLIAVVPPALVVTEAAVTAALKVVVPVEFRVKAPRAPFVAPPTMPVKVMLPEPDETVRGLAAEAVLSPFAALLIVEEKRTGPLPETLLRVTAGPVMVTAPVYV